MHIINKYNIYISCMYIPYPFIPAEVIAQKGLSNVTVDTLVQEMTPKARSKGKIVIMLD